MNRLREVRVLRRITQFQLRIATGIHQSKISLIENGLIEPYEYEKKRITEVLGVRVVGIWGKSYTRHDVPVAKLQPIARNKPTKISFNEGGMTWNKIDGHYSNVSGAESVVKSWGFHGILITFKKWLNF